MACPPKVRDQLRHRRADGSAAENHRIVQSTGLDAGIVSGSSASSEAARQRRIQAGPNLRGNKVRGILERLCRLNLRMIPQGQLPGLG